MAKKPTYEELEQRVKEFNAEITKRELERSIKTTDLRRRAEKFINSDPSKTRKIPSGDNRNLIEDLQIHQIELEMQNEELRRSKLELQAARDKYSDLYDLAPVGYITVSEEGLLLETNLTAATLLGKYRNELIKQTISKFILSTDQNTYYLHRKLLFETGEPQKFELRIVQTDKLPFWVQLDMAAAQDEGGAPVCRIAISDITKRKKAEEALRESEARLKRASDNSPTILYRVMMAPGGEISLPYVSDVIVATMGVTPEEVMKDPSKLLGMVHPEDKEMFQEGIMKSAESLESFPLTFRCMKDGEVIWIEARGVPTPLADGGILWDGFLLDITERKLAEEALQESEEHHHSFMESAKGFIAYRLEVDPENYFSGHLIFASPGIEDEIGVSPEAEFSEWFKSVHPDDLPALIEAQSKSVQNGDTFDQEFRWKNLMGGWRWCHAISNPVFDSEGKPKYFNGMIIDVTPQKQAEKSLQESERHLRSLMENATNFAVYRLISDDDNPSLLSVIFVSPSITDIMGVSGPMSFETWFEHVHPDDVERIVKANVEAFKTLRFDETMRIYHPREQKWVWIHAISTGFEDHERQCKYVNGILFDITRQKKSNEALRESEDKFRNFAEQSLVGIYLISDNVFKTPSPTHSICPRSSMAPTASRLRSPRASLRSVNLCAVRRKAQPIARPLTAN